MAIYLIDYENTGVKGLAGIERLKEEDQIILFYGPKTGSIPFDEHVRISQSASHVEYIKTTKTAKNYLDFQLTTYLGFLIAQTPVKEYHIVSKDSGYDSVIDFWSKRGLVMKRQDNIAGEKKAAALSKNAAKSTQTVRSARGGKKEMMQQKAADDAVETGAAAEQPAQGETQENAPKKTLKKTADSVPESVRKKIRAVLKSENLQGGAYKQIYACMQEGKDKQTFNTALVRAFTQERGNHYYKMLLHIFQEWKQKK